jgi:nitroreductase
MSLLNDLQWRYATKKMNGEIVPQEKLDYILEAARLAPTSSGLQPFEIIVISNKELQGKILPLAHGQSQIIDASHVLVFAAWDNYTADRVNEVFDFTIDIRNYRSADREAYRQSLLNSFSKQDAETNFSHAAKQAYIGLGTALIAAAIEEVDCTPMEGFDPLALDEILNLKDKGLRSVVLLPLGYRNAAEDWLVNLKKVRKPMADFVTHIE